MRYRRSLTVLSAALATGFTLTGMALAGGSSAAPAPSPAVIYNSAVIAPGNLPSVGAEAYSFKEFGNSVTFGGKNRSLVKATLTLSSWGCQAGSWNNHNCLTTPGAKFAEPITLNIYNPSPDGLHPGSLLQSVTQNFNIPYRPSASPKCTTLGFPGEWYSSVKKTCFNGMAVNVTFNIPATTVPARIVYGISYNTTHYGPNPIGESAPCFSGLGGCGYDSLNIGLSQDPINVKVGYDTNPGKVWQDALPGDYCDGGTAGSGFRLDSPTSTCWGVDAPYDAPFYTPAITFSALPVTATAPPSQSVSGPRRAAKALSS